MHCVIQICIVATSYLGLAKGPYQGVWATKVPKRRLTHLLEIFSDFDQDSLIHFLLRTSLSSSEITELLSQSTTSPLSPPLPSPPRLLLSLPSPSP